VNNRIESLADRKPRKFCVTLNGTRSSVTVIDSLDGETIRDSTDDDPVFYLRFCMQLGGTRTYTRDSIVRSAISYSPT